MVKNKWLTWAIVALVVANLATLTIFWLHASKNSNPPKPKRKGGAIEFLIKELNLSQPQVKQFEDEKEKFIKSKDSLDKVEGIAKDSLFNLFKQASYSTEEINKRMEQINQVNAQIQLLMFNHFLQLKSVCTPVQKEKFQQILHEALKQKPPPPHHGNRPMHEGHRPPPPEDDEKIPPPKD